MTFSLEFEVVTIDAVVELHFIELDCTKRKHDSVAEGLFPSGTMF